MNDRIITIRQNFPENFTIAVSIYNNGWGGDFKFIETEIYDGGSYVSMGTSQLLSVPYAQYSSQTGDTVWGKAGNNTFYNDGKVGIGTTNPIYDLEVVDTVADGFSDIGLTAKDAHGALAVYPSTLAFPFEHFADRMSLFSNAFTSSGLDLRADGLSSDIRFYSGGPFESNERMRIDSSGNVGIGTTNTNNSPYFKLHVETTGDYSGIQSHSLNGIGIWAKSINDAGIIAQSDNSFAGIFDGHVMVIGSLSKGSGSFVIDHPLDPENKLLRHNFVESPENLLIYRGKAELNSYGEATVEMPEYFQALTKEDDASIYLTSVGRPFPTGAEWNNDFSAIIIYGDSNREVFWEVLADRDDPVIHELDRPVEEEKGGDKSICEKGKLLYPEAYGYPESMSHFYEMKQTNK